MRDLEIFVKSAVYLMNQGAFVIMQSILFWISFKWVSATIPHIRRAYLIRWRRSFYINSKNFFHAVDFFIDNWTLAWLIVDTLVKSSKKIWSHHDSLLSSTIHTNVKSVSDLGGIYYDFSRFKPEQYFIQMTMKYVYYVVNYYGVTKKQLCCRQKMLCWCWETVECSG
jgi:hypothetical protein